MAEEIGRLIITLGVGTLSAICFMYAFKPYKNDDESFTEIFGVDFFFTPIIAFILWILKKILPDRLYVKAFRGVMFMFGVLLIIVIGMFW